MYGVYSSVAICTKDRTSTRASEATLKSAWLSLHNQDDTWHCSQTIFLTVSEGGAQGDVPITSAFSVAVCSSVAVALADASCSAVAFSVAVFSAFASADAVDSADAWA